MDNQHRQITGYRELSEAEIASMNEVKQLGETVGSLVERLREDTTTDPHWLSEARTHLQIGFMLLTRAIAKPTTFVLAVVTLGGC